MEVILIKIRHEEIESQLKQYFRNENKISMMQLEIKSLKEYIDKIISSLNENKYNINTMNYDNIVVKNSNDKKDSVQEKYILEDEEISKELKTIYIKIEKLELNINKIRTKNVQLDYILKLFEEEELLYLKHKYDENLSNIQISQALNKSVTTVYRFKKDILSKITKMLN